MRPRRPRFSVLLLALMGGVVGAVMMGWVVPLGALYLNLVEHARGAYHPWMAPERQPGGAWHSHLVLSDWYIIRPSRTTDSRLPLGNPIMVPSWVARPDELTPPSGTSLYEVHTAATGWPMRAVASEAWEFTVERAPGLGGYQETLRWNVVLTTTPRGRIMLPLRPIWPGLLMDMAFWTSVSGALLAAWRSCRGWLWARRGCCRECGYNLAGLAIGQGVVCPECGTRQER